MTQPPSAQSGGTPKHCECGEPFVSNEHGWLTCARGHYERTPKSRAEMAEAASRVAPDQTQPDRGD
jgi:hypothetical protein